MAILSNALYRVVSCSNQTKFLFCLCVYGCFITLLSKIIGIISVLCKNLLTDMSCASAPILSHSASLCKSYKHIRLILTLFIFSFNEGANCGNELVFMTVIATNAIINSTPVQLFVGLQQICVSWTEYKHSLLCQLVITNS